MFWASMDLWNIMHGSQKKSTFQCGSHGLKYIPNIWKKNALFIIRLNLADNQFAHIKSCKEPTEAWKMLCNIHKWRICPISSSSTRSFSRAKCKNNDLLDNVNMIKEFADQIDCLEVPMRDQNIVMTCWSGGWCRMIVWSPPWRQYQWRSLRWTMWWCIWCTRCQSGKKRSPNVRIPLLVLRQIKGGNSFPHQGIRTCFYCNILDFIMHFCYNVKRKNRKMQR